MGSAGIVQTKHHDGHLPLTGKSGDLPKIEIECPQDSPFLKGLLEDRPIRQPLKPLIPQMTCLVTLGHSPGNHPHVHSHIREKAHSGSL